MILPFYNEKSTLTSFFTQGIQLNLNFFIIYNLSFSYIKYIMKKKRIKQQSEEEFKHKARKSTNIHAYRIPLRTKKQKVPAGKTALMEE